MTELHETSAPGSFPRSSSRPRPGGWRTCLLVGVVLVAFVDMLAWIWAIPYDRAPDESAHMQITTYIAGHLQIPSPEDLEESQGQVHHTYAWVPPLASVLQAAAVRLVGAKDLRAQARAGRIVDALMGAATVGIAGWVGRLLFAGTAEQLLLPLLVASVPQFTFVSSYVNDDALGLLLSALFIGVALRALGREWAWEATLEMGAVWGLLLWCRPNTYIYGPLGLLWLVVGWRGSWRGLLARLSAAGGTCLVVAAPWLIHSYRISGTLISAAALPTRAGYLPGTLRAQGFSWLGLLLRTHWVTATFNSFWGHFDWMTLKMALWQYLALYAVTATAVVSLGRWFYRTERDRFWWIQIFFLLATLSSVALSMAFSLTRDFQPQGRYLFPALLPIASLLMVGWGAIWPQRRVWMLGALTGFLAYLNVSSYLLLRSTYG